jgi:hypothetical protein
VHDCPPGTVITVQHGEILWANGSVRDNYSNAPMRANYTCAGVGGTETCAWRAAGEGGVGSVCREESTAQRPSGSLRRPRTAHLTPQAP